MSTAATGVNGGTQRAKRYSVLDEAISIDLKVWKVAVVRKLSLKETGELMRALVSAHRTKRPTREQRILMAVFSQEECDQ